MLTVVHRLAVVVALVVLLPSSARSGDSSLVWKTVETEHFAVHYHEPLGDLGHRVAVVAERSYRVLTPVLGHAPTERTHIVLVDDTDGANGFANVVPRNAIRLYANAPSSLSVLNDHDDWMYGLVAHEYAHVIHLDTIGGLPALYNRLFGKTWAPNQVQPRWVIEGLATYQESRQSSSGRTRSALFDMQLRTAVLRGDELELDAVTSGPRAYPHGTTPYLYGSHFLKYVFDRYGEHNVAIMSNAYGSNPIPFGINKSIEKGVGKDFATLYDEWREHMRRKYRMQLAAIERRGLREGRRLTFTGETSSEPTYSPDGIWLLWRESDGYKHQRVMRMPRGDNVGRAETVVEIDRVAGFELLSDGRLVLERTTTSRTNYSFQDIYLYDPRRGYEQLTNGLRVSDPSVSPDERMVAFAVNGRGRSELAVMPLRKDVAHRVLWSPPDRYGQVDTPRWSPDGHNIVVSAWRAGGYRDIVVVDAESGQTTDITYDRAVDVSPVFSPDGRYLYYSSDRTGIYNIYAYDLRDATTWQVTNVVGCAVDLDVTPDGTLLVYRGFDSTGYDLFEIEVDPDQWLVPELYVNDRPEPTRIPDDEVEVSAPRPYRAIETLAPQNVQFQMVTDSWGSAVNLTTNGSDMVGLHSWSLGTTVGLTRGDLRVGAAYVYRGLWPSLRISGNRGLSSRSGYRIDEVNTRYDETNYGFTLRTDLPVFRSVRGTSNISLDYDVDWLINERDEFTEHDPTAPVPHYPETDVVVAGVSASWRYSDVSGSNWLVGPREGKSLGLTMSLDHPSLGSDFHALTLSYRFSGYYKLPWGDTPGLALTAAGGITTTDRARAGQFALGGVREQDVALAIRGTARVANTGYLRGFEQRAFYGLQYHLVNLEYRQLLWNIERGLSTLPVFVRRLHFAGLVDAGDAFNDGFDPRNFHYSVGGTLRLDVVFGYFAPGSFDIGFARGFGEHGIDELWFLLTSSI